MHTANSTVLIGTLALLLSACGPGSDPKTTTTTPTGSPSTGVATGTGTGSGTGSGTGTGTTTPDLDLDGDGVPASLDCDDDDPTAFPGNPEVCDGVDNDCANGPDDGLVFVDYFEDADNDGAGDPATAVSACAQPPGLIPTGGDCDDNDPTAFPGNPEVCDGVDNDCDTVQDNVTDVFVYADTDGDGYGDPSAPRAACGPALGEVTDATDCNDAASTVFPGAPVDFCDGFDTDCNGTVEEVFVPTDYATVADATAALDARPEPELLGICVEPGTYVGNAAVNRPLHIEGRDGAAASVLDGSTGVVAPVLRANQAITAVGLTLTNGIGGGLFAFGDTTIRECVISHNSHSSSNSAAGITAIGALLMEDSLVLGNTLTAVAFPVHGAGVQATNATIRRSQIVGNTIDCSGASYGFGGGVGLSSGSSLIEDSVIAGNSVGGCVSVWGGGLSLSGGSLVLDGVRVADNSLTTADYADGGGLYIEDADVLFQHGILSGNHVDASVRAEGGAMVQAYSGYVDLINVAVTANTASGSGAGGIFHTGVVTATNVSFDNHVGLAVEDVSGLFESQYTNWWANGTHYMGSANPFSEPTNLARDPEYLDTSSLNTASWDLHLDPGSLLRGVGDPTVASPSDVGAYGGLRADW